MSLHAYFRDDDRPLDRSFAQWVRQRSDSQLLARAALAASRAEALGHACANLGDDAQFDAQDLTALRAHAWVGDGTEVTPFVLDAAGH